MVWAGLKLSKSIVYIFHTELKWGDIRLTPKVYDQKSVNCDWRSFFSVAKNRGPLYGPQIWDKAKQFFACHRKCLLRVLRVVWDLTGDQRILKRSYFYVENRRLGKIISTFFRFMFREIEIWLQNQIKRNSSLLSLCLAYFRLPVRSQTTPSTHTRHFLITCKKPFGSISNLLPVKWSSVLVFLKF